MHRDELVSRTRQLIAEGERLERSPSLTALQTWLQLSDDLLSTAWGSMDRYHLAWLMVGKPKGIVRGRAMTADEEAAYVREVARQKTAALRMSVDAAERQGMPFRGETGGIGAGQGMGELPAPAADPTRAEGDAPGTPEGDAGGTARDGSTGGPAPERRPGRSIPLDPELQARLDAARAAAVDHAGHGERRAPRPERLQR